MRPESLQFFRDLLDAPGPSGDERAAARVWRAYAESFAAVRADALGSSFAEIQPEGSPSVAVFGHIDEIGFVVNHVDDEGYAWFGARRRMGSRGAGRSTRPHPRARRD